MATQPTASAAGKRIVICCDGTGQTIRAARPPGVGDSGATRINATGKSNVLRLFDLAEKDSADQIAFYDPGIGTFPGFERESRPLRRLRNVRDEWLGTGLMENVGEAYKFLMDNYEPGDRVYLFGFSRGAFTVRALAGMLRSVGLLGKGNEALLRYATGVVDHMAERHRKGGWQDRERDDDLAREFRKYARVDVRIAFLGVWDTVKAYGYLNPKGLPFVRNNGLVEISRHAVSIDEKRPPFQVTGLSDRRLRESGLTNEEIDHRVQEVWFAGDHSDVGGGHADDDNILAKAPFDWILREARAADLLIDFRRYYDATGWAVQASAPTSSRIHDLSRGPKAMVYRFPWRDLDNTHFPPARRWRFLGGGRRLVDHTFPDRVWRERNPAAADAQRPCRVHLHEAVAEWYERGIYRPDNLKAVFESGIERRTLAIPAADA